MKINLLSIFSVLLISATSQAAWIFEPAVGYQSGTTSSTMTPAYGSTKSSSTQTSTMVGVKFGYIFGNKMNLGLEYGMLTGGKSKTDGSTTETAFTSSDIFLNVGYEGGRWRGYFGYSPSTTVTYTDNTPQDKSTGSSMKVGVGYVLSKYVCLGAEYVMPTLSKYDDGTGAAAVDMSTFYSSLSTSGYNINLSFPFLF